MLVRLFTAESSADRAVQGRGTPCRLELAERASMSVSSSNNRCRQSGRIQPGALALQPARSSATDGHFGATQAAMAVSGHAYVLQKGTVQIRASRTIPAAPHSGSCWVGGVAGLMRPISTCSWRNERSDTSWERHGFGCERCRKKGAGGGGHAHACTRGARSQGRARRPRLRHGRHTCGAPAARGRSGDNAGRGAGRACLWHAAAHPAAAGRGGGAHEGGNASLIAAGWPARPAWPARRRDAATTAGMLRRGCVRRRRHRQA